MLGAGQGRGCCVGYRASLSALLTAAVTACGAASGDDAAGANNPPMLGETPGNGQGSPTDVEGAPFDAPCPDPLGTPEELALTPRADINLELLALVLEPGRAVASQATYERVVADIEEARRLESLLDDIDYYAPHDGRTLVVELTEEAMVAFTAGRDRAWQCLNEAYGGRMAPVIDFFGGFQFDLMLNGIYNLPLVAELYRRAPGVLFVEPRQSDGDASTLCAGHTGSHYEYVIDRAYSDCSSACTRHDAHHFASDAAGEVTKLGEWNSLSGEPTPDWFTRLCE
jgi:hypothetical protein